MNPKAIALISRRTKRVYSFSSMAQGNDFLGKSKNYLQNRICNLKRYDAEGRCGDVYDVQILGKGERRDLREGQQPRNAPGYYIPQLCWHCARASGYCPWSKNGEPVEGWDAEPQVIESTGTATYLIFQCPLFERDAKTLEERREQRKRLEAEREKEEMNHVNSDHRN